MFFWKSCFFDDPADVGNLISGPSAFSKTSLKICKFMVHIFLKPGLENFEHYFTSVWDELDVAIMYKALKFHKTLPDSSLLEKTTHTHIYNSLWYMKYKNWTRCKIGAKEGMIVVMEQRVYVWGKKLSFEGCAGVNLVS